MKIKKNLCLWVAQCFLVAAVILSMALIIVRFLQYQSENAKLERISEVTASYIVEAPAITQSGVNTIVTEDFIDIKALQKINPDTCGYIRIEGTQISYPVMQSDQIHKYLKTDFYGEKSLYGSIYLDQAGYLSGTNMVLYGHNMKSGKMFGELKFFLDEEYAKEHRKIRYITGEQIRIYELCVVFQSSTVQEELIRNLIPYNETEFDRLMDFISRHEGTVYQEVSWGDVLITLATCEYTEKDGRLFVVGRLLDTLQREE